MTAKLDPECRAELPSGLRIMVGRMPRIPRPGKAAPLTQLDKDLRALLHHGEGAWIEMNDGDIKTLDPELGKTDPVVRLRGRVSRTNNYATAEGLNLRLRQAKSGSGTYLVFVEVKFGQPKKDNKAKKKDA
jgi:hypothetical protein